MNMDVGPSKLRSLSPIGEAQQGGHLPHRDPRRSEAVQAVRPEAAGAVHHGRVLVAVLAAASQHSRRGQVAGHPDDLVVPHGQDDQIGPRQTLGQPSSQGAEGHGQPSPTSSPTQGGAHLARADNGQLRRGHDGPPR